jgi:hypothetical protein
MARASSRRDPGTVKPLPQGRPAVRDLSRASMANEDSKRNAGRPSSKDRQAEKAEALRANLRKRKAQARERDGTETRPGKLPRPES